MANASSKRESPVTIARRSAEPAPAEQSEANAAEPAPAPRFIRSSRARARVRAEGEDRENSANPRASVAAQETLKRGLDNLLKHVHGARQGQWPG
jgi:hypothetical protein